MEGLRHQFLAPAGTTAFIVLGCAHAMFEMSKTRYACKDDNGKPLLPHPYEPWTKVDPKYKELTDKAYRAFKMFDNIKEWTFLSLPVMWVFAIYGGALPFVNDNIMDGITVGSGALFCLGNHWYVKGYISSPQSRMKGFRIRRKVVEFWLGGSLVSVIYGVLDKFIL